MERALRSPRLQGRKKSQTQMTSTYQSLYSLGMPPQRRRAVGAVRLSNETDESTSPTRQRAVVQNWADANEVEIIGWATDLDVSAKITPWDRPELGSWLKRHEEFELLVFAKLDRAVRSLNDFVDLDRWGQEVGVYPVILAPMIDMSNMYGRAMGQVFAVFAELERNMIAQRVAEGYEELIQTKRWPGGRIHWCYDKIKIPGKEGWYLQPNQERTTLIRDVISKIVGGSSVQSQELRLEQEGVQTTRGGTNWGGGALMYVLRSRSLLGHRPMGDDVARDKNGLPVEYAEPVIDRATWDRLQTVLDANGKKLTGARKDSAPLLRVAFCGICYEPFHRQGHNTGRNAGLKYYQCRSTTNRKLESCGATPFPASQMEASVYEAILRRLGPVEVKERIYVPGEDHAVSLETAQRAYEELTEQLSTTRSSSGRKALSKRLSALDELIANLEDTPSRPASWRYEGTGETYNELWGRLSNPERGSFLRSLGIQAFVARTSATAVAVSVYLPKDLEEQAQVWSSARSGTV